ncbi:MAG TPA: hypothetical protein VNI01_09100, partial [Elusimicrobiota bacterium]|nr:hypothetical protein [Elusimicrobiota bacterium]
MHLSPRRTAGFAAKFSAGFLAALLVVPGPWVSQAVAATVRSSAAPGQSAAPALAIAAPLSAAQTPFGDLSSSALAAPAFEPGDISPAAPLSQPQAALAAPAAQLQAVAAEPAELAAQPALSARIAATPAAAALASPDAAAAASPTAALQHGAEQLGRASQSGVSGALGFLGSFFHGSRLAAADSSADAAAAPGAAAPASIGDLAARASDSAAPLAVRLAAIRTVAERGGDAARDALRAVAASNPEGGAADYEAHRIALRELATRFGELRSLRPISAAHEAAILAELKSGARTHAVTDYDDSFAEYAKPPSAEAAAVLPKVRDAGVKAAVLTDRPSRPTRPKEIGVLDSLDSLTAE